MKPVLCITLCSMLFTLTACRHHPAPPPVKRNNALIIGDPTHCGIENMVIFPVGSSYKSVTQDNGRSKKENRLRFEINSIETGNYDRLAKEEYINYNENEFDIRNILFYDLPTGQSYPLLSDTVHILSFALHLEFESKLIFYRIVKTDLNKDSIFNSSDPVTLFTSDLNGKNLVQVTPDNEQFIDYFYYPNTQTILVKTIIDADSTRSFTSTDETNFREVKLKMPAMGREIFSRSLKDSLRVQ